MKGKVIIWLVGILTIMVTCSCDGPGTGNGCENINKAIEAMNQVPTCGEGVIDDEGTIHESTDLFVNWNGPGAPTKPSNIPGFSDTPGVPRPLNAYSWTLASFGDHLYVGVYNRCNDKHGELGDISEGGEIWRYKAGAAVNSGQWEPEITGGWDNPTNLGIRIMKEYNGRLYAGTHNLDEGTELWRRSQDTATARGQWEKLATAGFTEPANNASRSMAVFNGKLYIGTANNPTGAKLFRFDDAADELTLVQKIGGPNIKANVLSELVPYGDHLWIFAWGGTVGFSAYRMDRQENIVYSGTVGQDMTNSGIMSTAVYNGKIYAGTVNTIKGAQMFALENPNVTDPKNAVWKRVGANVFLPTHNYLWRMQVFKEQLYVGTWNPVKTGRINYEPGATLYRMDKNEHYCQVVGKARLIEAGFGQSENYGVRSMAEHDGKLYIGTAQVFKIDPDKNDTNAAKRDGTEVWEFEPYQP
jgi:hypothetical protein